jgi:glyoxylase-like metal-dependent hydrolase (beta-lactamase superfamily II)
MLRSPLAVSLLLAPVIACSGIRARPPNLAQNRPLTAFSTVAAYPNSEPAVAILAAQQFIAARREKEGFEYFQRLAREQPGRPVLGSLEGLMQARLAADVPLLRRAAWVEEAIRKLDRGADAEPVAGRLLRGLVFAELPDRFGKAKQAVADLESSLRQRGSFALDLDRGILRGLALAYRTLGDGARSSEMLRRSGLASLEDGGVLGNVSVDAREGFRFTNPRMVREDEGVYVAEGFDFGNIAFLVDESGVVAIDAGTTEETARSALRALRQITSAPIRYVVLTHGHWDHVGGLAALREPGTVVIARTSFPEELARMRASPNVFGYFFGTRPNPLDATADRLIAREEVLRVGKLELRLMPVSGGETNDALFVHVPEKGLLFVGDAFMPYVGPPFLSEGSPEGYLEALAMVRSLAPRRVIHGHPPLTQLFNVDALPGLEQALRSLYDRFRPQALSSRPLAEMLHENYLPESLRETPRAVIPYLVVRDHFLERLQRQNAGYWQADGEGIETFTRGEWAAVLDRFGDGSDASFIRVAEDLLERGDAPLALRVAELGLIGHPASSGLAAARTRALSLLIERYSSSDPFRFIVYSQWAQRGLAPVAADEGAPPGAGGQQ